MIAEQVISGEMIDTEQARSLSLLKPASLPHLFAEASRIRESSFGNKVALCAIINAKSGLCPENCSFCAQSSHHSTGAALYPLLEEDTIVSQARAAAADGAVCYGIVTSGSGISAGEELDRLCSAIRRIRGEGIVSPGASLGSINLETALRLKEAGLVTYHHNLETSRSFFPSICSTHDYEEDVSTVRCAKKAGLRVCSGGIFGLGESMDQRLEMAITLRELAVDSVPINFLDPVQGTPLEGFDELTPMECLHIIALYRFMLPAARLTVCGGRVKNLRELQSWIFLAGADGLMTGNYLTKEGRRPDADRQMVLDQNLEIRGCLL